MMIALLGILFACLFAAAVAAPEGPALQLRGLDDKPADEAKPNDGKAADDGETEVPADETAADTTDVGEPDGDDTGSHSDKKDDESVLTADDNDLLERANALGFTQKDADELGSIEALRAAVSMAERRDRLHQMNTPAQAPQKKEPPPSRKLTLEVKPDDMDEPTYKAVQSINEHYGKVVDDYQTAIESLKEELNAAKGQIFVSAFDNFVASLGEDGHELFGVGPSDFLPPGSRELQNRQLLLKEHFQNAAMPGYNKTLPDGLRRALTGAFPDYHKLSERRRAAANRARRNGATAARPTGRGESMQTPEEKAYAYIRQTLRKVDDR